MARYVWVEAGVTVWEGDVLTDDILTEYDDAEIGDGAPTLIDTVTERSLTGDEACALIEARRNEEPTCLLPRCHYCGDAIECDERGGWQHAGPQPVDHEAA